MCRGVSGREGWQMTHQQMMVRQHELITLPKPQQRPKSIIHTPQTHTRTYTIHTYAQVHTTSFMWSSPSRSVSRTIENTYRAQQKIHTEGWSCASDVRESVRLERTIGLALFFETEWLLLTVTEDKDEDKAKPGTTIFGLAKKIKITKQDNPHQKSKTKACIHF